MHPDALKNIERMKKEEEEKVARMPEKMRNAVLSKDFKVMADFLEDNPTKLDISIILPYIFDLVCEQESGEGVRPYKDIIWKSVLKAKNTRDPLSDKAVRSGLSILKLCFTVEEASRLLLIVGGGYSSEELCHVVMTWQSFSYRGTLRKDVLDRLDEIFQNLSNRDALSYGLSAVIVSNAVEALLYSKDLRGLIAIEDLKGMNSFLVEYITRKIKSNPIPEHCKAFIEENFLGIK